MIIWQVAREYAGLAEAGGVKNVVCSLSEGLSQLGNKVTLFIPQYGCSDFSNVLDFEQIPNSSFDIEVDTKKYSVSFAKGKINDVEFNEETGNIEIIFVSLKKNILDKNNDVQVKFENIKCIGDYVLLNIDIVNE